MGVVALNVAAGPEPETVRAPSASKTTPTLRKLQLQHARQEVSVPRKDDNRISVPPAAHSHSLLFYRLLLSVEHNTNTWYGTE